LVSLWFQTDYENSLVARPYGCRSITRILWLRALMVAD
jgi:hypothetical protein